MIVSIEEEKVDEANEVLKSLLVGSQLDRFTVFSLELNLCFYKQSTPLVWLSTMQTVALSAPSSAQAEPINFQAGRRMLLGNLYELIGDSVTHAGISTSGNLDIHFASGAKLRLSDFDEDELLWSITSDSPSPFVPHDWVVSLLGAGELSVSTPKNLKKLQS